MSSRKVTVKTALTVLVLGATILVALPLHWVWWRTAKDSSLQLVDALSSQIAQTVRRELWDRVVAAEAAFGVSTTLIDHEVGTSAAERAIAVALSAAETPSAITFEGDDGARLVALRPPQGGVETRRNSREPTVAAKDAPEWIEPAADPASGQPAVAYAGRAGGAGTVAIYIELDRFAALLGAIPVGRTGSAFVVGPQGEARILSAQAATQTMAPVIRAAAAIVAARPASAVNIVEARRLVVAGENYRASFSPLEFKGWQLAVVVPEAEFLGEIEQTMRRALFSLVALAVVLGLAASVLTQRVLSRPLGALTGDLERIRRFELESIVHRPARLREFDDLSGALSRMASGLADFGKFIPTDLVRTLLSDGVRAAPGGETRRLTVLFADVAGFTTLSERLGTAVIDIVSRYLDMASHAVEANGGVVDKYIGDAVMALWGAPRADELQALNACKAALDMVAAVRAGGIVDDASEPLRIRIGINSGSAVVGNIGSARRLNYTAIGDTVNLASRLEGVNKIFGTAILISEATRQAAGAAIVTRELAEISVAGKTESIRVHELLDASGALGKPDWAKAYEAALAAYRSQKFAGAVRLLEEILRQRPEDGPARWLLAECAALRDNPPTAPWRSVVVLGSK